MTESAYAAHDEEFDDYGDDGFEDGQLPGRPRRQFLNRWSVGVLALLVGAAGFYIGVRVEKSSVSGASGGSSSLASAFASRFRAASGAAGSSTSGSSTTKSSTTAAGSSGAAGAAAGAFPGAGRFGANATLGTVSSVKGNTLYVRDSSGNTVKVKLSSATQITKRQTVSKKKIYPGDTLVIQGPTGSSGAVTATSITDSGSSGSSSGSSSNSTSSSGQSSVIGSLFGGG